MVEGIDFGSMTAQELKLLYDNVHLLPEEDQIQVLAVTQELERRAHARRCRDDLLEFCKHMDPSYIVAAHHKKLADLLVDIAFGIKDRVAVSIPPRHGKSHLVSTLYPAWFLGKFPDKKVLMASHTGDLAVDFGRKVRNLIASPAYQQIFPGVSLAQDSKSAGRWNTNHGGEYFACLTPNTPVCSVEGYVPASSVKVGDKLYTCNGVVDVLKVIHSTHSATVKIGNLTCSKNHPIWTFNRGWVKAGEIFSSDLLCSETIWDKLKARLRKVTHGSLEHSRISPLVQHQIQMHQPQKRQISFVRWARNLCVRTMDDVREFLRGYGRPADSRAYGGPQGQRRTLQPGELPLGGQHRTSEQQTHERAYSREDFGAARKGAKYDSRSTTLPYRSGANRSRNTEPEQKAQKEFETFSSPEGIGWARNCFARFFSSCFTGDQSRKRTSCAKGYFARAKQRAIELQGVLLGVRYAGIVEVEEHENRPFINYLVSGDNTFIAAGILTHNCGVGASIAGRGADLLLVDDPHSEQDLLAGNFDTLEKAYNWFTFGARTRLMSGGRIAVIHTRWHMDDLIGHLVADGVKNPKADQYEVFEFPAILDIEDKETGEFTQKALWPEKFDLEALERTKASMPAYQWNAQYMQSPTAEEAAIVKREWWRPWKADKPPQCDYVIMALDAAAEKHNRADFTALLTFGVFSDDHWTDGASHLILLNAINVRVEFPELKELAYREYADWEPDAFIVEKKSAGTQLYQELRRAGVSVQEFTPSKNTGDKVARMNAIADILRSGMVWYPEGRRWAEDVIEQCVAFPYGSHDDMVDCVSMALARFRQGGFIELPTDWRDPPTMYRPRARTYY